MRRKRAWEMGAGVARLVVIALAGVNGYRWHLQGQQPNARLSAELARPRVSRPAIRRLLGQGADIRTRGPLGETVLTAAVWGDDLSLAEQALDSGVPMDVTGRSLSPLSWAAGHGSSRMVDLLLARGARVDQRGDDPFRTTPLMQAASFDKAATIRTLLTRGADPTVRDDMRQTALDYAQGSSI